MLFLYATGTLLVHLAVLLAPVAPAGQVCSDVLTLALIVLVLSLRLRAGRQAGLLATVLLLAFVNASLRLDLLLANRLSPELEGAEITVLGSVASLPALAGESLRFELADVEAADGSTRLPRRLQVSWFQSVRRPGPGERWRLRVRLRPARGALNPAGPDTDGWYLQRGLGARATVVAHEAGHLPGARLDYPVLRLRAGLAARIKVALDGTAVAGLVTGLAVGLRNGITTPQWDVLKATGTGHLFAISGLHVGLVAGLCYWLAARCWGFSRTLCSLLAPVDAARPLALVAATGYAALAGFALPTQRALLMLALLFVARCARRPLSGDRLLLLALIIFVTLDPVGMLSTGFWLSFLAVATLILAVSDPAARRIWLLVRTQLNVFVGLAPLSLAAFGQIPLTAPIANLFMIPLFSLVLVPLVLGATLMMAIWPAADLPLHAAAKMLAHAWSLLIWLAQLDWLWQPRLDPWQWCALAGTCLALLLPAWPGKVWLLAAAALLTLSPPARSGSGTYRVTALDVGHGLSVVVTTSDHTLVYDLGTGHGAHSSFNQVVRHYLVSAGVRRPDLLVLSHDDARHVGDVQGYLRTFPATGLLSGAPHALNERFPAARPRPCLRGVSWRWDGVLFEILQPEREIAWEDDDSSCVVRISGNGVVTLVTGDLTRRGERALLDRYPQLRADLVVGLAHGSNRSSSGQFVRQLGARLALISTSANNPWGLPSEEVLARWHLSGTRVMVTGVEGAISVESAGGLAVSSARGRRAWHQN